MNACCYFTHLHALSCSIIELNARENRFDYKHRSKGGVAGIPPKTLAIMRRMASSASAF